MTYRAPVADMLFAMRHVAGLDRPDRRRPRARARGRYEPRPSWRRRRKFAGERLAPLNRIGDRAGRAP